MTWNWVYPLSFVQLLNRATPPSWITLHPTLLCFRYYNVLAYDQSRVSVKTEDNCHHYINANLVTVKDANRKYILTQGDEKAPIEYTCYLTAEVPTGCIVHANCVACRKGRKLMKFVSWKVFQMKLTDCSSMSHQLRHYFWFVRLSDKSNVLMFSAHLCDALCLIIVAPIMYSAFSGIKLDVTTT